MIKNKNLFLGAVILTALFVNGCQSDAPTNLSTQTQSDLPVPFSKGPTSDPSSMKGPTSPPPDFSSQTMEGSSAQSVSEKDHMQFTLEKNSSDEKLQTFEIKS